MEGGVRESFCPLAHTHRRGWAERDSRGKTPRHGVDALVHRVASQNRTFTSGSCEAVALLALSSRAWATRSCKARRRIPRERCTMHHAGPAGVVVVLSFAVMSFSSSSPFIVRRGHPYGRPCTMYEVHAAMHILCAGVVPPAAAAGHARTRLRASAATRKPARMPISRSTTRLDHARREPDSTPRADPPTHTCHTSNTHGLPPPRRHAGPEDGERHKRRGTRLWTVPELKRARGVSRGVGDQGTKRPPVRSGAVRVGPLARTHSCAPAPHRLTWY